MIFIFKNHLTYIKIDAIANYSLSKERVRKDACTWMC